MKKENFIDLSYEPYAGGFMIADYSDSNNVRFCGRRFEWRKQPIISDPFETKEAAEDAARLHFTGRILTIQ